MVNRRPVADSDEALVADVLEADFALFTPPVFSSMSGASAAPPKVLPVRRPSDPVLTGDSEIRAALGAARHVFVHRPDQLVPVRLTPAEARLFLRRAGGLPQPVLVTARYRGPDLVVRTLQYLGHPTRVGTPRSPHAPGAPGRADPPDPASQDPLRGLGRPRPVGRVTRDRPKHAILTVPVSRARGRFPGLPEGVAPLDDPDSDL